MTSSRVSLVLLVTACCVLLAPRIARAAENESATITNQERAEARELVASHCGSCHADYGMKAGKGPQLAGTQMTEREVEQRIHDGEPGYMPPFKLLLNQDQVKLLAKYVKSLKPEN